MDTKKINFYQNVPKLLVVLMAWEMLFGSVCYANILVGYWTVFADDSDRPRAIVRITRRNGLYNGRILRVYKARGDRDFCVKCPQPFTNKPITGLRLMWDLKTTGDMTFADGQILDPRDGRIYHCKATLSEDGKRLHVRAFLGLSLIGHTQTWIRRVDFNAGGSKKH